MEEIHNTSGVKYVKLKKILLENIKTGVYKPGEYLPSEKEIQDMYSISRTPVRKALQELEQEGYVKKEMGKGTKVISKQKVVQKLSKLASFSKDMKNKGLEPGYELLDFDLVKPPQKLEYRKPEEQRKNEAGNCIKIERLMLADAEPMALHYAYLFADKLKEKSEKLREDLSEGASLYKLLDDHYNIKLSYAKQFVGAKAADIEEANILDINPEDPLVMMDRLTYESNNKLIEYVEGFYRSDRYEYVIDMA